ncbi:MAG: pilus assembly protein, partial [Anaerolineae bacterium]|nr:pilus assembly protein [Anaerolineae bacterium]
MAQYKPQFNLKEKGQSLVEVALFLPIFLVIIAGLVEVSNILVTQNSVHNAARVGARFGASGGEDVGIALAALNSVTDVLDLEDTVWDIWAIRGKVAEDGTSFEEWEFNHSYGQKQTEAFSSVVEADIKAEVLKQLQTDENGNTPKKIAAGLDFVGTYLVYDLNSILGLNALESLAGITSVRSLNVMRNQGVDEVTTDACTAFP